MTSSISSICVYCGSSFGKDPAFKQTAEILGKTLAQNEIKLVYGGASVGLMGAVADAALAAGGQVEGVIPTSIAEKEIAHKGLSKLWVVDSMHERKAKMAELSDAFIALPGGLGTLEELFEMLTWGQLGFHQKPCGLLNVNGYYDHLLAFLDNCVTQALLKAENRDMLITAEDSQPLLDAFSQYKTNTVSKWI